MATLQDVLVEGIRRLEADDTRTARLDAQVLLASVLGMERAQLYAYPERELTPEQERRFLALIERRLRHEPVAYLVGHQEFYGRDFLVDRHVLIPRPETELLVEFALQSIRQSIAAGHLPLVADIGTGSGAIPITLAVEEPRLPYLYASDISEEALKIARANCGRHGVQDRVRLLQGDLLAPLPEPVDVLTANLPYVGTDESDLLEPDVYNYEPHLALFSGPAGLDLILRLLREARQSAALNRGATLLLEIGYRQREALEPLLAAEWPDASVTWKQDYAGWNRILVLRIR